MVVGLVDMRGNLLCIIMLIDFFKGGIALHAAAKPCLKTKPYLVFQLLELLSVIPAFDQYDCWFGVFKRLGFLHKGISGQNDPVFTGSDFYDSMIIDVSKISDIISRGPQIPGQPSQHAVCNKLHII